MSNSTNDPAPRFAPLTSLLVALLVIGVYYVASTVVVGIQFWTLAPTVFEDPEDVEGLTFAGWLGYSEPATVVVAVVMILAVVVGFFALKRSDRISSLNLSTLMVGVAIAPVIGFGLDFIVHGLLRQ